MWNKVFWECWLGRWVYAGWNSIPTSQLCPRAKYQRPRIPRCPTTCSRTQSETVNLGCKCLIFEDAVDCKSLKMLLIARDNIFNSQVHPQMMHQALVSERAASNYWKKETKCSIILHWYINWIKKQMSILSPTDDEKVGFLVKCSSFSPLLFTRTKT